MNQTYGRYVYMCVCTCMCMYIYAIMSDEFKKYEIHNIKDSKEFKQILCLKI